MWQYVARNNKSMTTGTFCVIWCCVYSCSSVTVYCAFQSCVSRQSDAWSFVTTMVCCMCKVVIERWGVVRHVTAWWFFTTCCWALQIAISRHHIPVTVSRFVLMFQKWIRVYIMKRFYHHFIFRSHCLNLANNILDFFLNFVLNLC